MSVYIKGIEMPTNCYKCEFMINCDSCEGWECYCTALSKSIGYEYEIFTDKRREDCPLIPVPPHGRLIDAGKLEELCNIMAEKCDGIGTSIWEQFRTTVEWCHTIIPADKESGK